MYTLKNKRHEIHNRKHKMECKVQFNIRYIITQYAMPYEQISLYKTHHQYLRFLEGILSSGDQNFDSIIDMSTMRVTTAFISI